MKKEFLTLTTLCLVAACGQMPADSAQAEAEMNDSNTPLHLLQPRYKTPYGIPAAADVKSTIDRVLAYIEGCTPTVVENRLTGEELTDYSLIDSTSQLRRGTFRLASYEWGVTYSALLSAAERTGDTRYAGYVGERFAFLSQVAPRFGQLLHSGLLNDPQMAQLLDPHALDDCGAMCVAMIKAQMRDSTLALDPLIENYFGHVAHRQYRLGDGTFARNRPHRNTLWLDDMFMGIPAVAYMGLYKNERAYTDEAVRQFFQFGQRMFVPQAGLYRHGWVEAMEEHPSFFWGRANGWAMLTACELLDAMPDGHPRRGEVTERLRAHIRGVAALQGCDGFWHQLLDRSDSYCETSATAIYVYCMAHAINRGWIDAAAYAPVVLLGWNAVASKINDRGQVEGTCVGTGMGFDAAFYCYRPVSPFAAHGYGPALWAGAEVMQLLATHFPKMNDSAVQLYRTPQKSDAPIFAADEYHNEIIH